MSIEHYKLKIVVLSMVLRNDVHRTYMWWIMIKIGERWNSLDSGLLGTGNSEYHIQRRIAGAAPVRLACRYATTPDV